MGVRFGTPAAAAAAALVLGCLLVLLTACGGPGRVSRDGTTCTGQLTGPGPEDGIARARQIDRNLAAHRYYQPSEP